MCGIAGILNFDRQESVEKALLKKMARQIAHRGPDDEGLHINKQIGLAHRRLSILDLSAAGHQPMVSESGRYWIVYNGEIYNFKHLQEEALQKGYPFRSSSDTEVLLAMFQYKGAECLAELNGMYAFAIWDTQEKELFLARDPLGIKPLYYYQDHRRFMFASEMKALLVVPDLPVGIDPEGLQNFFAHGHSTAPTTMCRGIRKLQPGHWLRIKDGRISESSFWRPKLGADHNGVSYSFADAARQLKKMLEDSVESHLVSDVPVGVFLSGGLDSSAMVALMAKHGHERIKTFTVGFDFGNHYSELNDAKIVANYFKTDHHELVLTKKDFQDSLGPLVYHFDEPFGDPAAFPTYFVSQLARQHVTVCLSGEGGDELFGGYRRYLTERYGALYRLLPGVLGRRVIPAVVARVPRARRLKQMIRTISITDPVVRQANWQMVFTDDLRHELFTRGVAETFDEAGIYESFRRHRCADGSDGMNGVLYADSRAWLADRYLEKADKMSMAHGLEARVPFLERGIAEFAYQLPIDFKVKLELKRKGNSLKRLLRQVLSNILPKVILEKPKHGFAVPLDPWFRGELSPFISEILFDERTRQRGYFNFQLIEKIFREHKEGREVRNNHLWLLVLFELWHRIFIDKRS